MKGIKKRIESQSPQIEFSEINIPDKNRIGTGSYLTVIKPNYLNKKEPIISIMFNPPSFQISVNINPATRKIPIMLGKVDGSDPISVKTFLLPERISKLNSYTFKVTFKDWKILELFMNEKSLETTKNLSINQIIREINLNDIIPKAISMRQGFMNYNINRKQFLKKQMELLEKLFPQDWFAKKPNINHPAYTRWKFCKGIIEQGGLLRMNMIKKQQN